MNACHEPISWLRLEHYHLGELPQEEHSHIQAHLHDCPHCRAMLADIEDDARTLPPLPLPDTARTPAEPWYRRYFTILTIGPVMAAALALLMLLPPASTQPELPGPRVQYKGGELAIALVRERAGVIQQDPDAYRDGDVFQVLITTPPGTHPWDLVVLQDGQAFFPLPAGTTPGGNRVPVGSFELTGPGDAAVCVMAGEGRVEHAILEAEGAEVLADGAVCVTLGQSTGGRP
jgi:hypothetical protein